MFCTVSWKVGLEGGEETALVQVWVNTDRYRQTYRCRDRQVHTDTHTKTDRETHSVYLLYNVQEGTVGPEWNEESVPAQVWASTDRCKDRQVHRQRERLTVSMFCMMSWKVGWVLKGAKRPRWYSRV